MLPRREKSTFFLVPRRATVLLATTMDFPASSEIELLHNPSAPFDQLQPPRLLQPGDVGLRQKELSPRSWPRLWASFEPLRLGWLALKRAGIVKDVRKLILFHYLHRFYFHLETRTLALERISIKQDFSEFARQKHLMSCVRFCGRFLRLESGDMWPYRSMFIQCAHSCSFRLGPCVHAGTWSRSRLSPEKTVVKPKDDEEPHQNI